MAIPFPAVLSPASTTFHLENTSRTGGISINGAEQVVRSGAGRWRATMEFPVAKEEWILSFRAFVAEIGGRSGECEVPVLDLYAPSDINGKRLSPYDTATLGSGQSAHLLHDGAGLGQHEPTHVTLYENAALRATRIKLTAGPSWTVPRPGQYFGINSRLYIATHSYRATEQDPWTVGFRPPLRAAASAGDRVITDRPVCTMRLAKDDTGELELRFARWGRATLEFVEAI